MRIRTLHIRNYRHFEDVVIHDLGDINVFAGPNNAGKTSLLRAVRETLNLWGVGKPHANSPRGPFVNFGLPMESCPGKRYEHGSIEHSCAVGFHVWPKADASRPLAETHELVVWGPGDALRKFGIRNATSHGVLQLGVFPRRTEYDELRKETSQIPMVDLDKTKTELFTWLKCSFFLWHRRKSEYAGKPQKQDALDADAVHLAARLLQLRGERQRDFNERLEAFINAVIPDLGEPTTRRLDDDKVEIMFGDRSLESLGGGVEQVLVLAMILLGEPDGGGIFIEEPESHLHPDAQHRLVEQILKYRGNRQFFLTTHSPVFLNGFGDDADVFRVTRANTGKAQVERCVKHGHQRHVLDDLGVRPSSLLQSNCVLWVEGPTERVLVRHWLSLVAPSLHEQRHYDFVYTGGSLLAHLGADVEKPSVADLQDLFRVCRHNYVICDRDAGPGAGPAKEDVHRIEGLLNDHLHLWVTHAYEIEWYYPREILAKLWNAEVATKLLGDAAFFARPFYGVLKETSEPDTTSAGKRKVEYARRAVKHTPRGSDLAAAWFQSDIGQSLHKEIERLAAFIRRANGLKT